MIQRKEVKYIMTCNMIHLMFLYYNYICGCVRFWNQVCYKYVIQFTLEIISHNKYTDKVLFCVADPVTKVYIKDVCPDATNLYFFYVCDKKCHGLHICPDCQCMLV